VLIVGSGASGAQIAEELVRAGRRVYLSVGRHKRMPRRYRERDLIWWLAALGLDQTPVEARDREKRKQNRKNPPTRRRSHARPPRPSKTRIRLLKAETEARASLQKPTNYKLFPPKRRILVKHDQI
jgi:cation diffusion facilitator CzcD-associated flavoprotein CzcO